MYVLDYLKSHCQHNGIFVLFSSRGQGQQNVQGARNFEYLLKKERLHTKDKYIVRKL